MGPPECSECSRECLGPFGIITVGICSIAGIKWLEGYIRITKLLLVFLMLAYFLFMVREMMLVDMTSHVSEIVDVCSDILVMLARVVDAVPLAPPRGVVHRHAVDRQNDFY